MTPPLKISELDSPTWKILTPLVEKKNFPKKGPTPLVEFWSLPPSKFLVLTPQVEIFFTPLLEFLPLPTSEYHPVIKEKLRETNAL